MMRANDVTQSHTCTLIASSTTREKEETACVYASLSSGDAGDGRSEAAASSSPHLQLSHATDCLSVFSVSRLWVREKDLAKKVDGHVMLAKITVAESLPQFTPYFDKKRRRNNENRE